MPETTGSGRKMTAPLLVILLLVALGAAAGAAYYYYSKLSALKTNPQKTSQQETKELVDRVAKLITLPADEVPTVATVSDPEKLKDQPFFAHAKKGDKVLIYSKAKKAILYDPVANKIVEVAPLNIGEPTGSATTTSP